MLIGTIFVVVFFLTLEPLCYVMSDDPKTKCDQARVVQRANHSVVIKLVKEVDEIIGTDWLTEEGTARLKVILTETNQWKSKY